MNIVLIRPSKVYFKESLQLDLTIQRLCVPLGLMYLSAVLKRSGFEHVRIIDCLVCPDTRVVRRGDYIFHGIEDDRLIEMLAHSKPEVIGITNNFTAQSLPAMNAVRRIKDAFPRTNMVLGGCHATVKAEELLQNPDVDYVVLGEVEASFPNLVKALHSGTDIFSVFYVFEPIR